MKEIIIKKPWVTLKCIWGSPSDPRVVVMGHSVQPFNLNFTKSKCLTAKVSRYDSVMIELINFKTILQRFVMLMAPKVDYETLDG